MIAIIFAFIFFFTFMLLPWPFDPSSPVSKFITDFYSMAPNNCEYSHVGGHNILLYVYAAILILSFAAFRIQKNRGPGRFRKTLIMITCIFVGILAGLQVKTQMRQFAFEYRHFAGKTTAEKLALPFPKTFPFSQFCRRLVPGKSSADFLTDMDTTKGDGQDQYLDLRYFLYPLDINHHSGADPRFLVMYEYPDPAQRVPNGFKLIGAFDQKSALAKSEAADE